MLGITWAVILSSKPYLKVIDYLEKKLNKPFSAVIEPLKCALCSGTWIGILYAICTTSNPVLIGLTAVASELTYRKLNTIEL